MLNPQGSRGIILVFYDSFFAGDRLACATLLCFVVNYWAGRLNKCVVNHVERFINQWYSCKFHSLCRLALKEKTKQKINKTKRKQLQHTTTTNKQTKASINPEHWSCHSWVGLRPRLQVFFVSIAKSTVPFLLIKKRLENNFRWLVPMFIRQQFRKSQFQNLLFLLPTRKQLKKISIFDQILHMDRTVERLNSITNSDGKHAMLSARMWTMLEHSRGLLNRAFLIGQFYQQ